MTCGGVKYGDGHRHCAMEAHRSMCGSAFMFESW
jgi:hypothetical protein